MAHRADSTSYEGSESGALTSMLDVIFNILAFFVFTFNPPQPDANSDVALPAINSVAAPGAANAIEIPALKETELDLSIRIELQSGPTGELAGIAVEGRKIQGGLSALQQRLRQLNGAMTFTGAEPAGVVLIAHPQLNYDAVIGTVDACYAAGLQKIAFQGPAAP